MNRSLLIAWTTGFLLLLPCADLDAHGGVYRGPGDVVPPTAGGDPGTPGPGNPVTPGPGRPSTPGGGRGPVTPGGGPSAPGGSSAGPRGPMTPGAGGRKARQGEGYEQWSFWWEYNKDAYLNLRESLGSQGAVSGSIGFLSGQGRKDTTALGRRPGAAEVNDDIVPILKSCLGERDADIVDSAVLALGRIVRPDTAALVRGDIESTLKNDNLTVKQAAILGLGVLGSRESLPTLIEIMNDSATGRALIGERGAIQDQQRAFAAVALGQIGDPYAIDSLKAIISQEKSSAVNLRSAAITALGLFHEQTVDIVPFLLDLLNDPKMERATRAQIPVALGRLGADSAIPGLLAILRSRASQDIRLEESCVIGLGLLAGPDDAEVIGTLSGIVANSDNEQARHFSFIALAQICSRAASDHVRYAEFLDGLVNKFFLRELTRSKKQSHAPWAGLSLGLVGRSLPAASHLRETIADKLLEAFQGTNNPSYKSAHAIGLGLLGASNSGKIIAAEMNDAKDTGLKGYLAVSLGMLRHTAALPDLRTLVLDNRDPTLRLQVATALGLMGDVQALPILLGAMKDAKTLGVIASVAKAIGLIGDRSAIEPLRALITDAGASGQARGFGCVALGLIAETDALPWNATLTANANYRIPLATLYEIADIL